MKQYVLCIAETTYGDVVFIEKNRPAWQEGKINFPGGKIEPNEEPLDACIREFREETGIEHKDWRHVGTMYRAEGDNAFNIYIFHAVSDEFEGVRPMTDEDVWCEFKEIIPKLEDQMVENVIWQLQMAQDKAVKFFTIEYK